MNSIFYEIKDNCRKNLVKYTIQAFSCIPHIEKPMILDMGCGTGVPALAVADICNGTIYAVDSDNSCLLWLRQKLAAFNNPDRIHVIHASVFDAVQFDNQFDVVLAEGLLNMVGFEAGLPVLIKFLKHRGFLIIHDEFYDDEAKKNIV